MPNISSPISQASPRVVSRHWASPDQLTHDQQRSPRLTPPEPSSGRSSEIGRLVRAAIEDVMQLGAANASTVVVTACATASSTSTKQPTFFDKMHRAVFDNYLSYVDANGYGLRMHRNAPCAGSTVCHRPLAWYKLPFVVAALKAPFVRNAFWSDCDSLFLTHQPLPLELLHETQHAAFTYEPGLGPFRASQVNSGHFLLRANSWSIALLSAAWEVYPPPEPARWYEQSSLIFLLGGSRMQCRAHIFREGCYDNLSGNMWSERMAVLPPSAFNALPWELHARPLTWVWMVHFFGDDVVYRDVLQQSKASIMLEFAQALAPSKTRQHADSSSTGQTRNRSGYPDGLVALIRRVHRNDRSG